MKLLFIRHGDPDYEHDTLTEKGHREAALLAKKLCKIPIDEFYMSPLGRAQDTAAYTLNKLGKKAEVLEWLREFPAKLDITGSEELIKAYPDTFVGRRSPKRRRRNSLSEADCLGYASGILDRTSGIF